jgi:hypothetical protein
MRSRLENDAGAEPQIVISSAESADRVVIDLDRTDLETIADSKVDPAAENTRETGC